MEKGSKRKTSLWQKGIIIGRIFFGEVDPPEPLLDDKEKERYGGSELHKILKN